MALKAMLSVKMMLALILIQYPYGAMMQNSLEEWAEQIKDIFENEGAIAVNLFVDKNLNDWKSIKLNVAVLGTSGTGKSSFINAKLGLTADDEGSAAVGVTETTTTIHDYPHPRHANLVLWDLPGAGTPNYNRENYFEKVNLNRFDYFIFMTTDRFRDDDIWLTKELLAKKKLFYFARNKIGQDIRNNKYDHPKTHTVAGVMDTIRRNCEHNIQKLNTSRIIKVYLIDTHESGKYEFGDLIDELIKDTPEKKKEAIILSMTHTTEYLIEEKREILSERIHQLSLLSAVYGALPVPLLDSVVDIAILLEEIKFYRDQFGLSDEQLEAYANRSEMSLKELTNHLHLQNRIIQITVKGVGSYMTKKIAEKAATHATAKYMKYLLPVFGNTVSGVASYTMTSLCLHEILDLMVEDAKKLMSIKQISESECNNNFIYTFYETNLQISNSMNYDLLGYLGEKVKVILCCN